MIEDKFQERNIIISSSIFDLNKDYDCIKYIFRCSYIYLCDAIISVINNKFGDESEECLTDFYEKLYNLFIASMNSILKQEVELINCIKLYPTDTLYDYEYYLSNYHSIIKEIEDYELYEDYNFEDDDDTDPEEHSDEYISDLYRINFEKSKNSIPISWSKLPRHFPNDILYLFDHFNTLLRYYNNQAGIFKIFNYLQVAMNDIAEIINTESFITINRVIDGIKILSGKGKYQIARILLSTIIEFILFLLYNIHFNKCNEKIRFVDVINQMYENNYISSELKHKLHAIREYRNLLHIQNKEHRFQIHGFRTSGEDELIADINTLLYLISIVKTQE